jgi:uncharacterized protein (TIGR03437 family)
MFAVSTVGNVLVGGSTNGFDLFVALKAASVTNSNFTGTYFTGALENDVSGSCGNANCIDSFSGSVAPNGQGVGTQHARLVGFDFSAYDYTSDLVYNFPSSGMYNDKVFEWILGANGLGFLQVGTSTFYTLIIGFQAKPASGSGTLLNPDGIVNAASFAPITNSVAPGEYVALFGSGLASNAKASLLPLPTSLGGAQLAVNGTPAPLYATAPTLITALLPTATPANDFAAFQLNANGSVPSPVTLYTAATAPGVFTSTADGIGPADLFHSDYTFVTQSNPARAGENLFFYATGLGLTNPAVGDGVAAPNPPAMVTDQNLSVDIFDSQGKVTTVKVAFAGLVPGLAGVYQLNFTMPSGVASGVGYLELSTTDGFTSQAKIYSQ